MRDTEITGAELTDDTVLGRRNFLLAAGGIAALAAAATPGTAAPVDASVGQVPVGGRALHFVDLTHKLTTQFNWMPTRPRIAMDPIVGSGYDVGMNLNRLMLVEHTGTHVDAPRHFKNDGASLGEMPLSDLVVPLVVIDITAKLATDRDAPLLPADVEAWEAKHGRLPDGCCVAITAGWDPLAEMGRSASLPPEERRKGPGFSPAVAEFLLAKRNVKGIASEAMSIDQGTNGPAYPFHQRWLKAGRWGIEGMTNLDKVPPSGAALIVGAAPIVDATGMPIRALAIF